VTKICFRCREEKPIGEFYRNSQNKDGLGCYCHPCHKIVCAGLQRKNRLEAIEVLGGKCVGCGITDTRLLTIDHIHGGGRHDRKAIGGPNVYYKWIVGHPEKYQLLCHNCNFLKRLEKDEHRKPVIRHRSPIPGP
jgi:hypothetical protein